MLRKEVNMVIYVVYEKFYSDFENGEDDKVFIESGFKNKKKAIKKAKALMNIAKQNHLYIDENIINKRNPFKRNNLVDFYKEEIDQEQKVSSIVIESTKLVA